MRYLIAVLSVAGVACTGAPPSLRPVGMMPVSPAQVQGWVGATAPRRPTIIRYGAAFVDRQNDAKGSGSISILPTDSLRLDFKAPLGMKRSAAAVVGDSALWAEPKEDVEKIIPSYPLLWAMVGVARPPHQGDQLRGLQSGEMTAWQYIAAGDTITYVRTPRQLQAEVTRGGKLFGQVTTTFGADGIITKSRLNVVSPQARLDITYRKVTDTTGFARSIWNAPEH